MTVRRKELKTRSPQADPPQVGPDGQSIRALQRGQAEERTKEIINILRHPVYRITHTSHILHSLAEDEHSVASTADHVSQVGDWCQLAYLLSGCCTWGTPRSESFRLEGTPAPLCNQGCHTEFDWARARGFFMSEGTHMTGRSSLFGTIWGTGSRGSGSIWGRLIGSLGKFL